MFFVNKLHVLFNKFFAFGGMDVAYIVKLMSWVDEPPQKKPKKKTKFYQSPNLAFVFFSKNREDDGTCHKAYCGWDHRTNDFLWKGGPLHPPKKKPLPFSWPQHSYSIQKSTLPCQFEDLPPPKKRKKENCFLSLLSQIVTCSTHSKEKRECWIIK